CSSVSPLIAASSSWSRTVPMNATTAPTLRSAARKRAISAPASKSSTWTLTAIASGAGHRREDRHFVAVGERMLGADEALVDGEADGASRRKLGRKCAAARAQRCDDRRDRRRVVRRQLERLADGRERFAQPREVDESQPNDGANGIAHRQEKSKAPTLDTRGRRLRLYDAARVRDVRSATASPVAPDPNRATDPRRIRRRSARSVRTRAAARAPASRRSAVRRRN